MTYISINELINTGRILQIGPVVPMINAFNQPNKETRQLFNVSID